MTHLTAHDEHLAETVEESSGENHTTRWVMVGLLLGIFCGLFFGEYCRFLQVIGNAYVGLLQMTVLPYLIVSLIAKMGRLQVNQAKRLGLSVLVVELLFWLIGIFLVVAISSTLPPIQGASFFSAVQEQVSNRQEDLFSRFIPTNIFRSLSFEWVPGIVLFCLFFGTAMIMVPDKDPLLNILDLCSAGIGHINKFLVRLAPFGLFTLTAGAAGTLYLEELSRLQAYLIMLTLVCVTTAFGILPLLLCCLTRIRYRDFMRAAEEPLLTAIATGKLFVVLPQIVDKCEHLLREQHQPDITTGESTANVVVPLAYPFPHLGKILTFVFISFAAWYVGRDLTPLQTTTMAATGAISSFGSPLVTIPYLLDQYYLPQDLLMFFILPAFITMRLGDIVGVVHLMVLTLIVDQIQQKRIRVQWMPLLWGVCSILVLLGSTGLICHHFLASTTPKFDLGERLLSLEVPDPYHNIQTYKSRKDVPPRTSTHTSTLDSIKTEKVLRVGYHPNHLPYSYINKQGELAGLDIELMHRLALRLDVRLEFIPYAYDTVVEQLNLGEIDLVIGGLILNPERLLQAGFTRPYQKATVSVVLPDHRRDEFNTWNDTNSLSHVRLAVVYDDLAVAAKRILPNAKIEVIDSIESFFTKNTDQLDGLIIAAEEGSAWNTLYPEFTVVTPRPVVKRPVAMAVRSSDTKWRAFLDGWLEFTQFDGSLDRLHLFWIEGGGAKAKPARWSVIKDVLHWTQ